MTESLAKTAPFRTDVFRNQEEFALYLRASDAERGARWLYERSLASRGEAVVLPGTCGLCLQPTRFTSPTHGGEQAPGGRVPNWREGQACGCEHQLISRERALLHFLLDAGLLRPWTRVLALGEATPIRPMLAKMSDHVELRAGSLEGVLPQVEVPRGGYHLILSVEQLTARVAQPEILGALAAMLAVGGTCVFTAPFATSPPVAQVQEAARLGPVGWDVLETLNASGFSAARACTYWSEELGYLGNFSMIIVASKK